MNNLLNELLRQDTKTIRRVSIVRATPPCKLIKNPEARRTVKTRGRAGLELNLNLNLSLFESIMQRGNQARSIWIFSSSPPILSGLLRIYGCVFQLVTFNPGC